MSRDEQQYRDRSSVRHRRIGFEISRSHAAPQYIFGMGTRYRRDHAAVTVRDAPSNRWLDQRIVELGESRTRMRGARRARLVRRIRWRCGVCLRASAARGSCCRRFGRSGDSDSRVDRRRSEPKRCAWLKSLRRSGNACDLERTGSCQQRRLACRRDPLEQNVDVPTSAAEQARSQSRAEKWQNSIGVSANFLVEIALPSSIERGLIRTRGN